MAESELDRELRTYFEQKGQPSEPENKESLSGPLLYETERTARIVQQLCAVEGRARLPIVALCTVCLAAAGGGIGLLIARVPEAQFCCLVGAAIGLWLGLRIVALITGAVETLCQTLIAQDHLMRQRGELVPSHLPETQTQLAES